MFDLADYIEANYPGALIRGRQKGRNKFVMRCLWRGKDMKPSGSLTFEHGVWKWYDHTVGQGGDAVTFLTKIEGRPMAEAMHIVYGNGRRDAPKPPVIKERVYTKPSDETRKILAEAQQALKQEGLPKTWARRGLRLKDAIGYGLGKRGQDTIIPIYDPNGELAAVKIRLDKGKYMYAESGYGAPPWFSPGFHSANTVLLVEGEGKAMSAHSALNAAGSDVATVGIAGSHGRLPLDELRGKVVYIIPEDDAAGQRAVYGDTTKKGWLKELEEAGIDAYVAVPMPDLCDVAHSYAYEYSAYKRNSPGNVEFGKQLLRYITSAHEANAARLWAKDALDRGLHMPAFSQFVGRANTLISFVNGILRHMSQGKHVMIDGKPVLRMSRTEIASMCAANRPNVTLIIRYGIEAGIISPHSERVFTSTTTTRQQRYASCYTINPSSIDPLISTSSKGIRPVQDANRRSSGVSNYLGYRGQALTQYLQEHGQATVKEIAQHFSWSIASVYNLIRRMQVMGITPGVNQGVVRLLLRWRRVLKDYWNWSTARIKDKIKRLWESVAWPFKDKKFWLPKSVNDTRLWLPKRVKD